jgi:hypothetical protein
MESVVSEKTPWNPSKKAIARVSNQLPVPTTCRHCDAEVKIAPHSEIYRGRSYGEWPWVYLCTGCGAYVGMHPFTNIPLGTLATEEIRAARTHCKIPFQRLYKSGVMGRTEAYAALAAALEIPMSECHFGWFDVEMCKRAEIAAQKIAGSA